MATYRFEQFNVDITNPQVEVVNVSDSIQDKTCNVSIVLTTDTAKFGVDLSGFTYVDSWEDVDIISWVNSELVQFEI